jgi:hypothetical protein
VCRQHWAALADFRRNAIAYGVSEGRIAEIRKREALAILNAVKSAEHYPQGDPIYGKD